MIPSKETCKKHDYENEWWCPYFDTERDVMIPTCWKCGKVKYQKIKYVGRNEDGSRIIINV